MVYYVLCSQSFTALFAKFVRIVKMRLSTNWNCPTSTVLARLKENNVDFGIVTLCAIAYVVRMYLILHHNRISFTVYVLVPKVTVPMGHWKSTSLFEFRISSFPFGFTKSKCYCVSYRKEINSPSWYDDSSSIISLTLNKRKYARQSNNTENEGDDELKIIFAQNLITILG